MTTEKETTEIHYSLTWDGEKYLARAVELRDMFLVTGQDPIEVLTMCRSNVAVACERFMLDGMILNPDCVVRPAASLVKAAEIMQAGLGIVVDPI